MANPVTSFLESTFVVSAQLLNSINAFRCMPIIGGATVSSGIAGEAISAAAEEVSDITGDYTTGGVRIEPTSYKVEYNAEVSEQVLVNIGKASEGTEANRQYFVDNIAPHPRVWRITGYIPSDLVTDTINLLPVYNGAGYTTSLLEHIVTQDWTTLQSTLKKKQDYLQTLFYQRKCFNFKTRDNEYISNAVMSQLIIERTPEAQNKLSIQVVIQEVNLLYVSAELDIGAKASASAGKSYNTDAISYGGTTAKVSPLSSKLAAYRTKGGVVAPQ